MFVFTIGDIIAAIVFFILFLLAIVIIFLCWFVNLINKMRL